MSLSPPGEDYIRQLVLERSAIVIEPRKSYLIDARLGPLARREGLADLEALVEALRRPGSLVLAKKVVEAMATNETSFFRDRHPFVALQQIALPTLLERRAAVRRLNIWCAASASGQEPYSILMVLREHFPALAGWDIRMIATDISTEMLERTKDGCYSQLEVNRGLPRPLMVKYFERVGMTWIVKDELRRTVETMELNLAAVWPALPMIDIVFLRNVLIYFDVETKKGILGKMKQVLHPDGYLFLGGAETTINLDDGFQRVEDTKSGCYQIRALTPRPR